MEEHAGHAELGNSDIQAIAKDHAEIDEEQLQMLAQCRVDWPDGLAADIVCIQAAVRQKLARKAFIERSNSVRCIQAAVRGTLVRRRVAGAKLALQLTDADTVPANLRLQPAERWPE
eukprot:SAG31_NODE_613_length_13545_cov_10.972557_13_plen_117_part_00